MAQTIKNLQCWRSGFDPWVGKIPWRRAWQPTPVFLPGESPWTEEPAGYSPWCCKESDATELLSTPSRAHVSFSLLKWNTSLTFLFSVWFIFMMSPGQFLASWIHQISFSVIRFRINILALGRCCCTGTTLTCGVWASLCRGFSRCRAWTLELPLGGCGAWA